MNVPEQMLLLTKLAQADVRIAELNRILAQGPKELQEKQQERDQAGSAVETAEQQRKETNQARIRAEADMETTDRRLAQSRKNAKRITSEAQAEASRVEIDSLERQRDELEERVIELMMKVEEIKERLPVLKRQYEARKKEFAEIEGKVPQLLEKSRAQAEAEGNARDELLGGLETTVRRLYNTAARRPGNPLTTIVDKVCQTCHATVPPQHLVETRQERSVHACANCKKIIAKVVFT